MQKAEEALMALLNEICASAEHSRCQINVGGCFIDDVYEIPGHHVLSRIVRAGRQKEFRVYEQQNNGVIRRHGLFMKRSQKSTPATQSTSYLKAQGDLERLTRSV